MGVSLYSYQEEAIKKLRSGSILCGGVGSGKSITSLAFYYVDICKGGLGGSLSPMKKPTDLYIITTARKRDTFEWDIELSKFLLSTKMEDCYHGTKVVVDSWNNIKKYEQVENAFFIFDEQRVVGKGVWVKTFLKITKSNKWILLSATPGDTWSDYIPVFIANGYYRNRTDFNRQHVVFSRITKFPKVERYLNQGKLIRLRNEVLVNMNDLRHTIQHHSYYKTAYDISLYDMAFKKRWDIEKGEPIRDGSRLCYLLRKIVNSDGTKVEAVNDIFKEHDKVIVFYNFDYELEVLKQYATKNDISFSEWNGHKHQGIPTTSSWIYFVQYTAGAEGWNCIETDTIIFYSESYSYKLMTQAAGRIDRLNTPYTDLYYYHLVSDASIDIGIKRALGKKKNFNEKSFYMSKSSR